MDKQPTETKEGGEMMESNWNETVENFEDLNIKEELLRGIYGFGFEKPSAIQKKGILPLLKGRDTIAQAQSGTGKTATFSIAVLDRVDTSNPNTQALILAPTRELAHQIQRVIICLGEFVQAKVYCCTGGTHIANDKKYLKEGVHIVVGTPGRVVDMMKRQYLHTSHLKMMIFDEADEMLSRGFEDQIREVFSLIPSDIQVGLYSATMPKFILEITESFMRNPAKILVKNEELTLDGIKQFYVAIDKEQFKFETLIELYNNLEIQQCIIYCNTKQSVDNLSKSMKEQNFTISSIHSAMESDQRDLIMQEFRTGSSRVLISTDLLARGIDIQQVHLVINYDLPQNKEKYIHRIGRSGRFGRQGTAINFVMPQDAKFLKEIEQYYNTQVEEMPFNVTNLLS